MKQRVVKVVCDNCKAEGDPDPKANRRNPLPLGWVTINIASDDGMMFDGDLCDKCINVIFVAIKKRAKK